MGILKSRVENQVERGSSPLYWMMIYMDSIAVYLNLVESVGEGLSYMQIWGLVG